MMNEWTAEQIAHSGTRDWTNALEAAIFDAKKYGCRMRVYQYQNGYWTIDVARSQPGPQ